MFLTQSQKIVFFSMAAVLAADLQVCASMEPELLKLIQLMFNLPEYT